MVSPAQLQPRQVSPESLRQTRPPATCVNVDLSSSPTSHRLSDPQPPFSSVELPSSLKEYQGGGCGFFSAQLCPRVLGSVVTPSESTVLFSSQGGGRGVGLKSAPVSPASFQEKRFFLCVLRDQTESLLPSIS